MYTSNLRRVGGSVMLAVPPAILEMLQMESGSAVSMAVESGRLIIEPNVRKKYCWPNVTPLHLFPAKTPYGQHHRPGAGSCSDAARRHLSGES